MGVVLPVSNEFLLENGPLISIITPYRNARGFLSGLIDTLQAQTYPHWECLLVNHASTDGGDILAKDLVAGDRRFRLLSVPDDAYDGLLQPAVPRNIALDQVCGDLVCFLDVDDLWHPAKLERQLLFHIRNQLDVSVTAYGRTCTRHSYWFTWRCPPHSLPLSQLLRGNLVPMLTVMANSDLFKSSGSHDPLRFPLLRHEDYGLWLEMWRRIPRLRYGCLPELLAMHQRHCGNITSKRILMVAWLYMVHRSKNNVPVAMWRTLVCGALKGYENISESLGLRRIYMDPVTSINGPSEPIRLAKQTTKCPPEEA